MYVSDVFVKAQHQYRTEQLKKSYPRDEERLRRRLWDPRAESPRPALKERKAW